MEVTVSTAHSIYMLRPSRELNDILAGCLGRALELYPVRLHAVVAMSSHVHLLVSPESSRQLADFMGHLTGNLSKKVGKLHGWSGSMFDRRYDAAAVSAEPAAQIGRLRYLLRQGCKEGLVLSPRDWPGVHSAVALCDGEPIRGTWIDRTEYWKARNRGEDVVPSQFGTDYEIQLEPLPCWAHLEEEAWRSLVREMVEAIERETLNEHRWNGTAPAGASSVLRMSPRYTPSPRIRSPAPLLHAATRKVRMAMRQSLSEFVSAYREAADRLRGGEVSVSFPADCFPPGLPYVPPA